MQNRRELLFYENVLLLLFTVFIFSFFLNALNYTILLCSLYVHQSVYIGSCNPSSDLKFSSINKLPKSLTGV